MSNEFSSNPPVRRTADADQGFSPETLSKKCPDCAEPIKLEARVCRHCGRQFSEDEIDQAVNIARAEWKPTVVQSEVTLYQGYSVTITSDYVITKDKRVAVADIQPIQSIQQKRGNQFVLVMLDSRGQELHYLHGDKGSVEVLMQIGQEINRAIQLHRGQPPTATTIQLITKSQTWGCWVWAFIIAAGILLAVFLMQIG